MKLKATIDFDLDSSLYLDSENMLELWQTRFDDFMCDYRRIISHEVKVEEV